VHKEVDRQARLKYLERTLLLRIPARVDADCRGGVGRTESENWALMKQLEGCQRLSAAIEAERRAVKVAAELPRWCRMPWVTIAWDGMVSAYKWLRSVGV
jgi:hypothetical protein